MLQGNSNFTVYQQFDCTLAVSGHRRLDTGDFCLKDQRIWLSGLRRMEKKSRLVAGHKGEII